MSIWDSIVKPVTDIINKVVPDKAAQQAAIAQLEQLKETDYAKQVEDDVKVQLAGLDNVKAEASGQSWLQRNWRPMTALTFVGLVVAYWFGFTAPNLPPAEVDHLFSIIQVCLGGYTLGRTAEKIVPGIVAAIKK